MDVYCKHRYVDLASLYAFNAQKILISPHYVRVRLPLVLLPQVNSPWNLNSWMLFTAQLPWTALWSFSTLLLKQGFRNGNTLIKDLLVLPYILAFQLQFCLLQKSEAGYRDANSMFSACGIDESSPLSLQGEGVCIIFCPNSVDVTLNANP